MSHPFEALTPDCVIDAVEAAGHLSDARILALNSYENRVYQVGIEGNTPVIVKFYRPGRWSNEQILEEHAFTLELAELEIPVVAPNVYEGNTLLEYQGFRYAIFPRRGGRAPDLDNPDNLLVMGRFLGRLHAVGAVRPFRHRLSLGIDNYGEASMAFLLEHDFIPRDLHASYESLARDLIRAVKAVYAVYGNATSLRIHGDCHMGNVLLRDDTPNFVDFDDTLMGPAIQDLWMLLSGDDNERRLQLDELVSGYEEFREFDVRELGLIEALRTLRLMHYSAWLARRWDDPAFPLHFPWFNTPRYWAEHILELREQLAALSEPPLTLGY